MTEASDPNSKESIDEEHAVWKKNSPLLYDWVSTYSLEWPSLTVQWLPEMSKSSRSDYNIHRMIIGTNTSDQEPNYLMIAEVELPSIDAEIDVRKNPDGSDTFGSRFCKDVQIKTRILHDGEINRARYMPQNTVSVYYYSLQYPAIKVPNLFSSSIILPSP